MNTCPACATPAPTPERLTLLTCPRCAVRFLPQGNTHVFVFTEVGGQEEQAGAPELSPEFRAAFALGRVLGVGGQATVYEARDRRTGASVAVKFLKRLASEEHLRRFLREFELLETIDSPHVVKVIARGEAGGHPYLVSELLTGGSLAARLAIGPLPLREAGSLMADVLAGLAACHERGIVHRDLKPANVLLDGEGRAKLADLGIAKAAGSGDAQLTAPGMILGTVAYMSPEHLMGEAVTPASDMYAAGMLLHEMVLGRLPIPKVSIPDVVAFHRRRGQLALDAGVPAGVAQLIERALATPVDRRPRDARAFAEELEAALARRPPRATRPASVIQPEPAPSAHTVVAPISGAQTAAAQHTVEAPISGRVPTPNPHFWPALFATFMLVSISLGLSLLKVPPSPRAIAPSRTPPPEPTPRVIASPTIAPPTTPEPSRVAPAATPVLPPASAKALPRFEAGKLERTPIWIALLEKMSDRRSARAVPGRGADYSGIAITTAYGVPYSERKTFDSVYAAVVLFGRALSQDTGRQDLLVGQESLDPAITYLLPDPDSVDRILSGEDPADVARAGRGAIETTTASGPAAADDWWADAYRKLENRELATQRVAGPGDTAATMVREAYNVPRGNVAALARALDAVIRFNVALRRLHPARAFVTDAPLERGAKYFLPDPRSVGRLLKGDDADRVVRDALEEPQNLAKALAR